MMLSGCSFVVVGLLYCQYFNPIHVLKKSTYTVKTRELKVNDLEDDILMYDTTTWPLLSRIFTNDGIEYVCDGGVCEKESRPNIPLEPTENIGLDVTSTVLGVNHEKEDQTIETLPIVIITVLSLIFITFFSCIAYHFRPTKCHPSNNQDEVETSNPDEEEETSNPDEEETTPKHPDISPDPSIPTQSIDNDSNPITSTPMPTLTPQRNIPHFSVSSLSTVSSLSIDSSNTQLLDNKYLQPNTPESSPWTTLSIDSPWNSDASTEYYEIEMRSNPESSDNWHDDYTATSSNNEVFFRKY